jgi:hypothetical protein
MFFAHILLGRRGGIYPARRTRCPQPNSDSALNLAPPLSIRGPNAGRRVLVHLSEQAVLQPGGLAIPRVDIRNRTDDVYFARSYINARRIRVRS